MIAEWLTAVEYRDWRFELHDHDEGPLLSISFTVPDSRQPGEMQDQRVWVFIPPMTRANDFYRWLRWRLARIAVHEVGEFFRVNGTIWADPHRPLEQQLKET